MGIRDHRLPALKKTLPASLVAFTFCCGYQAQKVFDSDVVAGLFPLAFNGKIVSFKDGGLLIKAVEFIH